MATNKIKKIIASALLICGISLSNITDTKTTSAAEVLPSIFYSTHVQNEGWQESKSDGELAGTEGKGLRLEGISMNISGDSNLQIKYKTHVQSYGWQDWKTGGVMAGTEGKAKRLEGIRIELTGKDADKYDVLYQVHVQSIGWQSWKKNGEMAGTEGRSLRLEGIRIKICKKDGVTDSSDSSDVSDNSDTIPSNQANYIDVPELGVIDYSDTFTNHYGDTYVYCKELSEKVLAKVNEYRLSRGHTKLIPSEEIDKYIVDGILDTTGDGVLNFSSFDFDSGWYREEYGDILCSHTLPELKNIDADKIAQDMITGLFSINGTVEDLAHTKKIDRRGSVKIYICKRDFGGETSYVLQGILMTDREEYLDGYGYIQVGAGDSIG